MFDIRTRSEFYYDAFRRRRIRKEYELLNSAWQLKEEIRYVYDGMLAVEERDRFNSVRTTYTRGTDVSGSFATAGGIGGLLARTGYDAPVAEHAYYFHDGRGNILSLRDNEARERGSYSYDPFGNEMSRRGINGNKNRYRFSSKETHIESGTIYYGHRYYDPMLHRWLNPDPMGELADLNLYRFNYSDPVNFVDANGLWGIQFGGINFGWGDPNLAFDNNSWMHLSDGAAATADGLIPFGDPFSDLYRNGDIWSDEAEGLSESDREILERSYTGGKIAQFCFASATPFRPFTRARQPITHWGGPLKPGSWVMTGGPTVRNWLMAGAAWNPGKYTVATALPGTLKWPSGWEWFKGFLGQRIFSP